VASLFIPPINIIKRLVDKLSTLYVDPPTRTAENQKDQMLIDYYTETVNSSMSEANRFFNSMKAVAVEPFIDNGDPMTRVVSGHQCLAKGSDPINPLKMTEFIKPMGKIKDEYGNDRLLFFVYSSNEFYAIDDNGKLVSEYQVKGGVNPLGIIPQTYIKRSKNLLIPKADSDLLQMGVMLPTMIGNLNYASHMQGHSIIYGIDIDGTNLEINPDSLWLLQTSPAGVKPDIGMLKPSVDITEIWQSIASQLQMWFETRGIRAGESTGTQNSLSGIALMIKEMDVSADIKYQMAFFKEAEQDLWYKLSVQHNYWVDQGLVVGLPKFSPEFMPVIEFQEAKAYEDQDKILDREIKKIDNLLTSRKRARQKINKDMSQKDLDALEVEIMEEIGAKEPSIQQDIDQQEVLEGAEASDSI
jgi:hypothetical protein